MERLEAPEAARRLASGVLLVDVREPWEAAIASAGGLLIPLGTLPGALGQLDPTRPTIVICHHGVRSLHACFYLESQGFTRVANLEGGIDAWSVEVDERVPRY